MVKRLASMFVRNGHSVGDALRDRRRDALGRWRELVHAHVAGKPIDLAEVEQLAVAIRAGDPGASFGGDCDALLAANETTDEMTRDTEIMNQAASDALAAQGELFAARRRVQELELVIARANYAAYAPAAARRRLREIWASAPRLFAEVLAADDAPAGSPAVDMVEALDTRLAVAAVAVDATSLQPGEAYFVEDDDD